MAPEMLDGNKHNCKVDIWALGITAINLATGKIPYENLKPFQCMKAIKENDSPTLEGEFSDKFKDFVNKCLIKDPEERYSASELLNHPFVKHSKRISDLIHLIFIIP